MRYSFLLGQRVIVQCQYAPGEIGTVVKPEGGAMVRDDKSWVFRPSCGFASCFANENIKALPGGQL